MGKASRWLRSFFVAAGWKGRKAKDRDKQADDVDSQSVSSAALPTPASARERRRWSFRRPAAAVASKVDAAGASSGQGPLAPSSSQCFFPEAEVRVDVVVVRDQHAVAVTVPEAAASTVASLMPPVLEGSGCGGGDGQEAAAAAIKIQSAFRSYLARKALCALRGMVKLQAMVRGQLVRRQANATLRRMQALVDAQMRARAERLRILEDDGGGRQRATTTPPSPRRSPRHAPPRKAVEAVDDGGGCYATPAAAGLYQKVSPTPSALTDASARTLSGRFDDASCTSASEPTSRLKAWRADHAPPFPSYLANTESSRAKARSQSEPRQRFVASSESAAASPSPSCGERPSSGSGGARRRASLDLLAARAAAHWSSLGRAERCASRARARAGAGASLTRSPAARD